MSPKPVPNPIRVGGYAPAGSVHSRALEHFAEVVQAESEGEIEVEVLHNILDLGRPSTDLFELVRSGELTWCYHSTSYLGPTVPALDALEIPFLFEGLDQAHQALDGALGQRLAEAVAVDAGLEVLGFWDNGFRHLTNQVRPIRRPEDCAGLRIRLQPNPIHEALTRAWGMEPVLMELSQGIEAIKQGEVDAQENPLANTVAYGVEHRHVTLSAHLYGARGLFADPGVLAGLGEAGQLITRAARAAIAFQRNAAADYETELQARLSAEGREIIESSPTERATFARAAEPVTAQARAALPTDVAKLLP